MEIQGVGTDEGAGEGEKGWKLGLDHKKRGNNIRSACAFVSGSILNSACYVTLYRVRQQAEEAEEEAAAKTFYFYTFFFLRRACERVSEGARDATAGRTKRGPRTDRTEARYLSLARSLSFFHSRSLALPPSLPPSLGHELLSNSNMWSQCALARSLARPFSSASTIWQSQRTPRDTTRCGWESGSQNRLNPDKRRSNIHMENAILGAQQFYN